MRGFTKAGTNRPVRLHRMNKLVCVFRRSRLIGQMSKQENGRWYVLPCLRLCERQGEEHVDEYAIRRVTYKRFTSGLRKLLRTARTHEQLGRIVGENTFDRRW